MDMGGGLPLKQRQDIGTQELWSPGTPVKNIPTRRQIVSSPNYSQRNHVSETSWLDPVVVQAATPPWGFSFQNAVCSTPGLPDCQQGLNCSQAGAQASASQATNGNFMPHSATISSNAVLMNSWSPKLGKMRPLTPLFENNGNCRVMPASSNQLALNGKALAAQGCYERSRNWVGQKALYGSTVSQLPSLNSFPESTTSFSVAGAMPNFINHMNPEIYGQRMQYKQQSPEVINVINEQVGEQNLEMKVMPAEAYFTNLMTSAEYAYFQDPNCANELAVLSDEVSYQLTGRENSLVEREKEDVDLDDASKQKPKKKKHRPKVIIEGKPARTPKPGTPKPKTPKAARNTENALGKRKYTRRKKDATSCSDATPCSDAKALGEIVDAESQSGSKPVRRSLNFDLVESQTAEKFSHLLSMFMQNLENQELRTCEDNNLISCRLKEKVDPTVVQGPIVENSLSGIVFDLRSSASEPQNEYLKILQSLPSPTVSQNVEASNNIVNSNHVIDTPPIGKKRDHCLPDEVQGLAETNLMASYDAGDNSYKNHDAERQSPCITDITKRMRMENGYKQSALSPILTYTPSSGWKTIQASNNSQEFTFNGKMKLMAQERLQTLERVLLREEADLNTHAYPILSNNLSSLIDLMDYNRNSILVKPSLQNNIDIRQPPTPEKPTDYICSQESTICGTLLQFETSEDVNKPVKVKGRRGRKKREENPPTNPCSLPSSTVASHCQISQGKTTKTSTQLHGKSLNNEVISFSQQDTKNYEASTNSSIHSLSTYIDFMDHIVEKLRRLSLNEEHEVVCSQAQNAIVPYARIGGAMVPYEGTFDLNRRRRPRAKVDLDPETNRVWKLLMGTEGEQNEGASVDKEIWWEEERQVFRGRVDSFIARMHLVQGDRRFSQWKGSVVDSVIGVFLTQNVSDHLSSSAFMALAAKFPLRSGDAARSFNAEKVNTPSENQIECITSLVDSSNSQRNVQDHDYYSQASLETNDTQNDGKKENSTSNETFGSGTGSSSAIYYAGKTLESHETELSFGQESPNSGSNTAVTVARSINSVEIEDRRLLEEVVSSQNSGVSSHNSNGSQVVSSDHINSSSELIIEEDDLLIRSLNNGFGPSSFTELLHIAESNKFQELYGHDSMPSANSEVIHMMGNNLPVLNHMDDSKGTCQPYQADFTPYHTVFGLSPDAESFYSRNPSNFMISENNPYTIKEDIRSSLQSNTCEIVSGNKFEVNHGECRGPTGENLAAPDSLDKILLTSGTVGAIDSHVPIRTPNAEQSFLRKEIGFNQQSFSLNKLVLGPDASSNIENSHGLSNIQANNVARSQQKDGHSKFDAEISQEAVRAQNQMENCRNPMTSSTLNMEVQNKLDIDQTFRSIMKDQDYKVQNVSSETSKQGEKARRRRAESEKKTYDWDSLRKEVIGNKHTRERSSGAMDSLDWEAVRCADVREIAEAIRERGMNNILAERIKDFLNRLVREHGDIDLEWLRDVPADKSKDYLLSIRGLGLKSTECVRLLTLHHLAFPVDTNVGRICVRLGWVPLQPLPESLQLHLLELYPILETIQKYLWPRLCKLDQRTLYELHYQMITFGKVFCTKSKPNCNACPMRGECRHFASAFASARLALPAPEDKSIVSSTYPIASDHGMAPVFTPSSIPQLECSSLSQELTIQKSCEPIIEEPSTPEPENLESEIEDAFFEDPDEIPTIKLNFEKFTQNLQNYMHENMEVQAADMSKALVALTPEAASIPVPKLKNISRLRTEHQVYELPDSHPLLEELDKREADDPCPYLLAIWTPGETAQSTEPPKACCDSQDTGQLCDRSTCSACSSLRESQAQKVRGTLLIPCRTAMRGSFPLNGTYFQVNEVFADHHTSRNPIDIPRDWIWNLARRTVCFGTSIPTIFRGLTTEGIQQCFWRGFVCVRGFDRVTRAPKPLYARLHFPASKAPKMPKRVAAEATGMAVAEGTAVAVDEHSNNTSDLTGIHH